MLVKFNIKTANITGSAITLRKYQIRLPPPCKIVTPKSFNLNLCTHDYVCELHAMQILVLIDTVGASPQIGEILPPCDVFDCLVLSCPVLTFFLDSTPRSNRWTDFHALWLKRRVSAQGSSFWGLERWLLAGMGNFQSKRQNIKIAISPKLLIGSKPNLRIKLRPAIALCGWSNITHIKSNMAAVGHLEKNRYNVITPPTIV